MATTTKRPRSLTLGKSLSTAARAAVPVAAGAGGALAGTLAARYALAKVKPDAYASSTILPVVAGATGAIVGGALPIALLTSTRTKSAAERAYKATIPLGALGVLGVLLATTLGPKVWAWFRSKAPTVSMTANVTGTSRQLVGATMVAQSAAKQLQAAGAARPAGESSAVRALPELRRAAGLPPSQRRALEAGSRAAGLPPGERARLEGGRTGSSRWAI